MASKELYCYFETNRKMTNEKIAETILSDFVVDSNISCESDRETAEECKFKNEKVIKVKIIIEVEQ